MRHPPPCARDLASTAGHPKPATWRQCRAPRPRDLTPTARYQTPAPMPTGRCPMP